MKSNRSLLIFFKPKLSVNLQFFFFLPERPQGLSVLLLSPAWPFPATLLPSLSLFGPPCESLISWVPHLPLSSFIPICWRSFYKNDLRNDIGGRCKSPCVWNHIHLDVWLVFRWAEYFRLKVIFPQDLKDTAPYILLSLFLLNNFICFQLCWVFVAAQAFV